MGRRKERRHAASSSNRRVKLDLFAEPSGDLVGSSPKDDVGGGEDDSKNRAGLSNSPSSSGQAQNPLLLLGQYSDDELDDVSKGANTDHADGSFGEADKQDKMGDEENEDEGIHGGDESVSMKVEEFILAMDMEKAGEDDPVAKEATNRTNSNGDIHLSEQTAPPTSDNQDNAITTSGWKMVLHEESNQYYYWNTETGETSWEAPEVLVLATESIYGDKAAIGSTQEENGLANKPISSLTPDGIVDSSTLIDGNNGSVLDTSQEGLKNGVLEENREGYDGPQVMLQSNYGPLDSQYLERPVVCASSRSLENSLVGYQIASVGNSVVCGPDMRHLGEYEDGSKLSSHLIGLCENLLEQLRPMNRSNDDFVLRSIVEVETRLSDMKALASNGSPLLPFWVHSEKQLLQLKAILNDKIDKFEYVQLNQSENADNPDNPDESDGPNPITGSTMNILDRVTDGVSDVLSSDKCQKNPRAYENGTLSTEHVSSASDPEGTGDLDRPATQDETTSNAILNSGDDADMDVDMEVEDAIPPEMSDSDFHIAALQSLPSSLTGNIESSGPELAFCVPPPPDGDWIPPPPPDNEPFPPPPPEEPPESPQPPPPGSEPVHMVSYTEQYNQSYPSADMVYYGQTEFPSSNLYTYSEGHQASISQSSLYFNSGQAAFGATPVVEPGVYYTLQDVTSNTTAAGLESSIVGSVSGHSSFVPNSSGSLNSYPPANYSVLPEIKSDVLVVSGETEKGCLKVPSFLPTVPVTETASVPSTLIAPASATVAAAAASKGQPKVLRTKKRTGAVVSTLRSNKKVSSMVDKWKAAKEEMLEEEEEEPETYMEKLEKKRQREIEEWRTRQIASGEAKENANFQPLGGDWRERVKRKRAKLAKERDQSTSEGGGTERTEQPDLNELSKGLPSGWQVYWDDSSKRVYYGNAITSETLWTRPTN